MGDLRDNRRGPSLLLFGPQTTSFSNKSLSELRSALKGQKWAVDTLSELPAILETASTRIPTLRSIPGKQLLENLHKWLTDGPPEYDVGDLPNTLLAPLTVLTQLTEYQRYLELHHGDAPDAHATLVRAKNTTALGFCEGLLTAYAISSSASTQEWNHNAAVAVRLAMLVGAVVDGTDETHSYGASESFATACHTREQDIALGRILSEFHNEAYVSVWYDERRATVTASKSEASSLLQELRQAGIVAATMGLRGRFHSEQNRRFADALIHLCDVEPALTFTDSANLALPTYTNAGDGNPVLGDGLHRVALREILVQQCNWHKTISAVVETLAHGEERLVVTSIGPGMSIKVAGADDVVEFSSMLRSGKSQHQEVPPERVPFGNSPWRPEDTSGRKWYGNFMRDVDAFDHKFFRKSPRESAAMDPQQRLILQAAYQAVEQSGYFSSNDPDKHIGVYLGTCATDYDQNAACHAAGAYTVTGLLRGFIAGKVSHYFGWTGPSMTLDTACSGSAVAIHSAVKALRSGTPVGDPAEYQSIRTALGGTNRRKPLPLGSVKGFVGHTESASGIVSLIKVITMMHEGFIPPQASHLNMSHRLDATASDMIALPTSLQTWTEEHKAALINNYGASGSNAAMVVMQAPRRSGEASARTPDNAALPFCITGFDSHSIAAYCAKLVAFIQEKPETTSLADLSFNMNRQTNRNLPRALLFRCNTIAGLAEQLSPAAALQPIEVKPTRPVILCFGGQHSTFVGLDRKLVAGRARIVRDSWGPDPGAMMAVDGDLQLVEWLLEESNRAREGGSPASIACYNGPQSFTLAGSVPAIDSVCEILSSDARYNSVKSKRLNVTNAFHSALVDPLIPSLEQVGLDLTFHDPVIRLERATETSSSNLAFSSSFVPDHMRKPVFFHHAVQRLLKDYPSAIWLEAGSASKITSMAKRVVGSGSNSHFQGVSLTEDRGIEGLTDATLSLWKEGLRMTFWPHHGAQAAQDHAPLLLPPYQFEKSRHWLDLKAVPLLGPPQREETLPEDPSLGLWSFVGYQDTEKRHARFKINTECERYRSFISPHVAVQTAPICSATLEYTMATEALFSLRDDIPSMKNKTLHPIIRDMHNDAPLCINPTRSAWLDLRADDNPIRRSWAWSIVTAPVGQQPDNSSILCVQGKLELRSPDDIAEFARYERLVTHEGCVSVLQDEAGADNGLQGRSIYRALADVVDYGEVYRGASRVVGRGSECAGIVLNPTTQASSAEGNWLGDIPVVDSYSQVAGVWVNCMADRQPGDSDVFLATGCELIMRSPVFSREDRRRLPGKAWHVLAKHHRESEKAFLTDLFVFDAVDGRLTEVMLGIRYSRIAKLSMSRVLERLSDPSVVQARAHNSNKHGDVLAVESHAVHRPQLPLIPPQAVNHRQEADVRKTTKSPHSDLSQKVRDVVAIVSGVEASDIRDDSELADLGVDSLAGMELAREIESVLHYKPNMEELLFEATTFRELVACISRAVGGPDDLVDPEQIYEDGDDPSSPSHGGTLSDRSCDTQIIITPGSQDLPFMDGQDGNAAIEAVIAKTSSLTTRDEKLSQYDILDAFAQVKVTTDQRIRDNKVDITDSIIMARSNRLCVALIVEAFEQVGCPLRVASAGQVIQRISHPPQHARLVDWLYSFLEKDARLVDINGSRITRTAIPAPRKTSEAIYQELLQANDTWIVAHKLAYYAGKNLADVISGKKDGIQALFGSPEGRDLVRGLYCDLPFNRLFYEQMRDTIRALVEKLPADFQGPLRILEMGAGTGGTTYILAPFLATLNIPVEYTITDLSPSMVAQARRTFGAQYPFMRFAVHDIEQLPDKSLLGTEHIVVASNAIHATADLAASASNIRAALRPDGLLLLTEMTEGLPFVDIVFGLLEGWWRFADDRVHALVSAEHWAARLREAGFGHVDWTDGSLSENNIQKVIMATSSCLEGEIPVTPALPPPFTTVQENTNVAAREEEARKYVAQYSAGFMTAASTSYDNIQEKDEPQHEHDIGAVIIVTGGTGSLGSHLVARFAEDPSVSSVICLNRRSSGNTSPLDRQQEALSSRGIKLSPDASSKLSVYATDTSQPHLGLPPAEYAGLVERTTHIVHNAWPMTANRPLRSFDTQFQVLRHLLDLAAEISASNTGNAKRVCFQFISSIGVAGQGLGSSSRVPEERLPFASVPPVGYCEAKWASERILDETLHRHPDRFRTMVVRPGQIAGSSATGLWNPTEHFAFLVRSAQSLRAFPVLEGRLQWVPVDSVAGTCADLALNEEADGPVYHVDNPVGQPWEEMVDVLIRELDIPRSNVMPFIEWIRKVRRSPLAMETENPALRMADFLEKHFVRISCVGVILDTAKAREKSPTLAAQGPIPAELGRLHLTVFYAIHEWMLQATAFL
ncbi:putative polyketide protein [Eutypa lata UCREL1]|uniref:Putative polyketide protein n=1 Tax=Eutypa lata (strain UCR-EL1) TaxID=1287681 RepID=M7SMR0_EUTLA|nr:putative polyketide protein [Eutypa lata UCREL1]